MECQSNGEQFFFVKKTLSLFLLEIIIILENSTFMDMNTIKIECVSSSRGAHSTRDVDANTMGFDSPISILKLEKIFIVCIVYITASPFVNRKLDRAHKWNHFIFELKLLELVLL